MSLKCEQFIYAMFDNYGYKPPIVSPNLLHIISQDMLQKLIHVGDKEKHETIIPLYWEPEKLITISYIKLVEDKFGRQGIWNHTIIIRVKDFIYYAQPTLLIQKYFIRDEESLPLKLEPLIIGTQENE
jgi:hypothetical protein